MQTPILSLLVASLALGITGTVQATIISGSVTSGSGSFIKLSVPFSDSDPDNTVGDDTFQNTNLYGFDEGQNILISVDLNVDDLADGLGGGSGPGVVSLGTTVASHYIFFDPAGTASQVGTVGFDSDILGVLSSTTNLAASDFLINTGVTYLNPVLRGLEAGDSVAITGLREMTVDWTARTPGDYVRVLTEFSPGAVTEAPAPSVLALLAAGLAGISLARRRANKRMLVQRS
jgi:hypothetical protein